MIVIWFVLFLIILFLITLFVVYDVIFSSNRRYMGDENSLPKGEQYEPYHETITMDMGLATEQQHILE